jgi:uncharacterized protein YcbX
MESMELTALYRYPVKSLGGHACHALTVDERGPQFDRRWMIVEPSGHFITQRQHPRMCLIQTTLDGAGLTLTAPDMAPLVVRPVERGAARLEVVVWDDAVEASTCGSDPDRWLSEFLGLACRLVYLPDDSVRAVDPGFATASDQVGFADGYPFLLISQASLDDLSRRVGRPLSMLRFRPNLVVDGCDAYAEDDWKRIRIGALEFRVAKACSRCAIPTIDPQSAERDPTVMRTLLGYRRREDRQTYFGQNLLHDGLGQLELGMQIEMLE